MSYKVKYKGTSSRYIGVTYIKRDNVWRAQIRDEYGKQRHIAQCNNEEDAAREYDKALRKLPIREDVKVYNFSFI